MARFLSPEWINDLAAAAAADEALAQATKGVHLVVEQQVTDTPQGTLVHHVRFDDGTTTVASGPAPDMTVRFTQDLPTATAIAKGEESAQRAFMSGRLQVGGVVRSLLDHAELLAVLSDTFASVSQQTTYDWPGTSEAVAN